jgi:hypothetical protein
METNLIGYYKIDSDIFVAVSDRKQIKMIPMIKTVLDGNDFVRVSYSTKYNIYYIIFIFYFIENDMKIILLII